MAGNPAVITGCGKRQDGQLLFIVSSQTQAGRYYVVTHYGNSLRCNCQAGQYGKHCAHVAAVRARLQRALSGGIGALSIPREYAMRAPLSVMEDKTPEKPRPLTAQMDVQTLRDTAPMYRSNAGFSIFKQ